MKKLLYTVALLGVLGGIYWILYGIGYGPYLPGYHTFFYPSDQYFTTLDSLSGEVDSLKDAYKFAFVNADREATIDTAGQVFESNLVNKLFPYWYGTEYDFDGKTEVPGSGTIACGYFVTTVLEDMGFPIARDALAQAPSEELVMALVEDDKIERFSDVVITDFLQAVKNKGEGIFVVGLDTHTGFLWYDGTEVYFIHASARAPHAVVRERAISSPTLTYSKYRVLGKISDDKKFLSSWLEIEAPR